MATGAECMTCREVHHGGLRAGALSCTSVDPDLDSSASASAATGESEKARGHAKKKRKEAQLAEAAAKKAQLRIARGIFCVSCAETGHFECRGGSGAGSPGRSGGGRFGDEPAAKRARVAAGSPPHRNPPDDASVVCYQCQGRGHIARDCPRAPEQSAAPPRSGAAGSQCFTCQGYGHFSRDCPRAPQQRVSHGHAPQPQHGLFDFPPLWRFVAHAFCLFWHFHGFDPNCLLFC